VQVNGVTQKPMQGIAMNFSFDDAEAPERHETQYFEIFGNRGIYHQGWSAITKHRTPWQTTGDVGIAFDDDVWELYDGSNDWTQARDLSKENPAMLHELQRLFVIEATRNNVLPLDDRSFERVLPDVAGRPSLISGKTQVLLPGMGGLNEQNVADWRNRSYTVTAEIGVPADGASGVLINLGGEIGGWAFYLKDGCPAYCYNYFGIERTHVRSDEQVPEGDHQVRMEFAYDGEGRGKGGDVTLYTDGKAVGSGRVERTEPIGFGYEYTDVGRDGLSPVTDDYPQRDNAFTGTIKWIELSSEEIGAEHTIDPEQFFQLVMAKQ
jgi:arylsulfatase